MDMESKIAAARVRLQLATKAWQPVSKKRKEVRPQNAQQIHDEFKEARHALDILLKDGKSKIVKQEVLDTLPAAQTSSDSGVFLPHLVSTSKSPINVDEIDDTALNGTTQPLTFISPDASIRSQAPSQAPNSAPNGTTDQNGAHISPGTVAAYVSADLQTTGKSGLRLEAENHSQSTPNAYGNTNAMDAMALHGGVQASPGQAAVPVAAMLLTSANASSAAAESVPAVTQTYESHAAAAAAAFVPAISHIPDAHAAMSVPPMLPTAEETSAATAAASLPTIMKTPNTILVDKTQTARPLQSKVDESSAKELEDTGPAIDPLLLAEDVTIASLNAATATAQAELSKQAEALTPPLLKVLVPVSKDHYDELVACIRTHDEAMREIQDMETQLCLPMPRTMFHIRSELAKIDNRYEFCTAQKNRVKELQAIIEEADRAYEAATQRSTLQAKRSRLEEERVTTSSLFMSISPDHLADLQASFSRILLEIKATDNQLALLDASQPSKSVLPSHATSQEVKVRPKRRNEDAKVPRKKARPAKVVASDDEDTYAPRFNHADWGADEDDAREEAIWAGLSAEERLNHADDIRNAMAKYDRTGDIQHFHHSFRRSLRHIQCLLPNDAFDSKKAAIAIFLSTQSNLICRFHKRFQKQRLHDNQDNSSVKIQGVPFKPLYRQKKAPRPDGCMDCGCLIDDVLMDFYFWKTLTITSPLKQLIGYEEPMKGTFFDPRQRAFLIAAWKNATGLTTDDIYSSDHPRGMTPIARENWLMNLSMHRLATIWVLRTGVDVKIIYPSRDKDEAESNLEDIKLIGRPWYN